MNESSHPKHPQVIDQPTSEARPAYWWSLTQRLAAWHHEHCRSRRLVDFYLLIILTRVSEAAVCVSCTNHLVDCFF